MTAAELDLYRRVSRVIRELRDGYGPMMKTVKRGSACVERGVVARRLVDEVTEWIGEMDGEDEEGGADE